MTMAQVAALEREIDALNADLSPLKSFVLPGGTRGGRGAASGASDLPASRARDRRARGEGGGGRARHRLRQPAFRLSVRRRALRQSSRRRRHPVGSRRAIADDEGPLRMTHICLRRPPFPRCPSKATSGAIRSPHLLRRAQLRRPRQGDGPRRRPRKAVLFPQVGDGADPQRRDDPLSRRHQQLPLRGRTRRRHRRARLPYRRSTTRSAPSTATLAAST